MNMTDDTPLATIDEFSQLALPITVVVPDTLEGVDAYFDGAMPVRNAIDWGAAAHIWSWVEPGEGEGGKEPSNNGQISAREFTRRKYRGFSSPTTVLKYHKAWDNAIKDGIAQPVTRGEPAALPTEVIQLPGSVSDNEWYTPPWLFEALGVDFTIDVCSPEGGVAWIPAARYYTQDDDGLTQPWHGTVWCNPPYSDADPWAEKIIDHGDGLLLTHIPMNAEWAADVWQTCAGIRLFQGIEFVRPDGKLYRPGYWLQLAAFGDTAFDALADMAIPPEIIANPRRVPSPLWTPH